MTNPLFPVEKIKARKNTLACTTGLSTKSYRNATKEGCVLRTEPRRKIVNHAVISETIRAIVDMTGEMISISFLKTKK